MTGIDDTTPPAAIQRVTVVTVNWNSGEELARLLGDVHRQQGIAASVVVVDNGSVDDSVERARAVAGPEVRFVLTRRNTGYCEGNNIGISNARPGDPILIVNPDVEFSSPDTIAGLIRCLDDRPNFAAIGPVVRQDGELDYTLSIFDATHCDIRLIRSGVVSSRPLPWIHGCVLLLRSEALREIGGFDERFFIIFDEVDWCARARRAGWQVGLCPDQEVVHRVAMREHATRERLGQLHKGTYYSWRNRYLICATYAEPTGTWQRYYLRALGRYILGRSGASRTDRVLAIRGFVDALRGRTGPGHRDRPTSRRHTPGW